MDTSRPTPAIRPARLDELESLLALQQSSLRALGAENYPREVLEAALAYMGTMDPRMIADGTYLVAELHGELVGCAGWSTRRLPYARLLLGSMPPLPAECGKVGGVRSLYVAPGAARHGVGRALLAQVEGAMAAAGCETAELLVALSGEGFFHAHGYVALSTHAFKLADGIEFEMRRMMHPLSVEAVTSHRGVAEAPCRPAEAAG